MKMCWPGDIDTPLITSTGVQCRQEATLGVAISMDNSQNCRPYRFTVPPTSCLIHLNCWQLKCFCTNNTFVHGKEFFFFNLYFQEPKYGIGLLKKANISTNKKYFFFFWRWEHNTISWFSNLRYIQLTMTLRLMTAFWLSGFSKVTVIFSVIWKTDLEQSADQCPMLLLEPIV